MGVGEAGICLGMSGPGGVVPPERERERERAQERLLIRDVRPDLRDHALGQKPRRRVRDGLWLNRLAISKGVKATLSHSSKGQVELHVSVPNVFPTTVETWANS